MQQNKVILFCVYHQIFFDQEDDPLDDNVFYFGVNEVYPKSKDRDNIFLEYELKIYNPFLQKRGYMETSAYLHVYWNHLYKEAEMVGFYQYDMKVQTDWKDLQKDTLYLLHSGRYMVTDNEWNELMFPEIRNLNFLMESYNKHFGTTYTRNNLEKLPLSLWQTNIYPVSIYEKLCTWLEVLVDEIYPWSNQPPYETHFGSIGGYTERAIGLFNALEILKGAPYGTVETIGVSQCGGMVKEQYNTKSFLNNYSQDIHTTFVEDITGDYPNVNYCMFKAQYYWNGVYYCCERVNKNGQNGLYFSTNGEKWREHASEIEGEDPRIVIVHGNVWVLFICLSPFPIQERCIGMTPFERWDPVFLQVENMEHQTVEKNWAPFVKDEKLYFVYHYDPLVILQYDFNPQGICKVIFTQNDCVLPLETSKTYLRGGSNLIPYKEEYYIGGCHSRIGKDVFEHYTHIILLNTNTWEIVYVSKPVMFLYQSDRECNAWHVQPGSKKQLDTFHNILVDKTPNIIQDPVSLYQKEDKFYMSINVRDCVTLLYELTFSNLLDFAQTNRPMGFYDMDVKNNILKL